MLAAAGRCSASGRTAHLASKHAHVRSTGSFFDRLRDAYFGRSLVGTDEKGNRYYVKAPDSPTMVAQTSHVKEIRSVEFAGGTSYENCALAWHEFAARPVLHDLCVGCGVLSNVRRPRLHPARMACVAIWASETAADGDRRRREAAAATADERARCDAA
jgi:hypothetical protein